MSDAARYGMSDFETVAATEIPGRAARAPSGEPGRAATSVGISRGKPRSLAGDAWRDLRRNPIFWIAWSLVAAGHR